MTGGYLFFVDCCFFSCPVTFLAGDIASSYCNSSGLQKEYFTSVKNTSHGNLWALTTGDSVFTVIINITQ